MGPKKDKKGKKKKEKIKRPKILKSEYLAKIADRNAVLAASRTRIQKVKDVYYNTEKRYEQTQEDLADIIKYLQHEIEENELEIEAFDEKIEIYKKEINKNDKYYQSKVATLEAEYENKEKEMQDQFQQNIAKLSAFEDVRKQREEYFKRKEQIYQKMKEMETRHKNEIYEAQKPEVKQKEIEYHIDKLINDFKQTTDVSIIINANKVIKDNIALGNTLTSTQEIFERARDSYCKIYELEKKYKYNAELLQEEHNKAMKKYEKQVHCIQTLLKTQHDLSQEIKRSEKLILDNRRFCREIAEKECILKEKEAELSYLQKVLKEHNEIYNSIRTVFNIWRKKVISLEMCLYEAAKRVKHGIDTEKITTLLDENGVSVDVADEEQEETLKELKYKTRETALEEIIEILGNELLSHTKMQQPTPSSQFSLASNNSSTISDDFRV